MDTNKNTQNKAPRIGEVYNIYFEGDGHVQSGWRPGVVFQNNTGNRFSPNLIVLPLTSSLKKIGMPTHVLVRAKDSGLRLDSMVICENPQCVAKEKVGHYITTLSSHYMAQVAVAHLAATSALSLLDFPTLVSAWQESSRYNRAA